MLIFLAALVMEIRRPIQAFVMYNIVKVWYGCGEETFTIFLKMPLPPSQFDALHTGRADPSRYLIIGFDTEYQRYADEDTRTFDTERINLIVM